VHLSHKPKAWRSAEPDWYEAMRRTLSEIVLLEQAIEGVVRVVVAGDVFDHWNAPAELINFAIRQFQRFANVHVIPGQHDMPNHSWNEMYRSAFETLCLSKAATPGSTYDLGTDGVSLETFGWEEPLRRVPKSHRTNVAVIHKYVWMQGCSYLNAPKTGKCTRLAKDLGTPDYIFAGDNHQGFYHAKSGVFNCGSLMRTTKDQIDYKPRIAILFADGTLVPYYLDTSDDVYLTTDNVKDVVDSVDEEDFDEFVNELKQMGRGGLDYLTAVRKVVKSTGVRRRVQRIIHNILEEING
jgi:DNA repair exonuclease SbcCD nuclease subunit